MQSITTTTRGLAVLVAVNWDRLAGLGLVAAALLAGAWLSSLGLR